MPLTSITRVFTFDAGHRILNHESRCAFLHGHTYRAEITIMLDGDLDKLGRVIDFGNIKELFGGWIDGALDHNMILNPHDPFAIWLSGTSHVQAKANGRDPWFMPIEYPNPTAENIARLLLERCNNLLKQTDRLDQMYVSKVDLWETPNCKATYELPRDIDLKVQVTNYEADSAIKTITLKSQRPKETL